MTPQYFVWEFAVASILAPAPPKESGNKTQDSYVKTTHGGPKRIKSQFPAPTCIDSLGGRGRLAAVRSIFGQKLRGSFLESSKIY